ncbi:thioesterase [Rhodobacterales bacterium 59_46_T64]|nr:thioesterase [Rhodobacterales bacterium 59_46_T64]
MTNTVRPVLMEAPELETFLAEVFPQVRDDFAIDHVEPMKVTVRLKTAERHLRPGGTVSGPSMFGLADVSVYVAVMAMIGPKAMSVTTNCSIDFMRKPVANVDLIAKCTLLKLGRALAVGDVLLFSEGMEAPVARATLTYSIPPRD